MIEENYSAILKDRFGVAVKRTVSLICIVDSRGIKRKKVKK